MLLIANGCSHTSGAEIEYELQGICYDKAWPKKLASSFGWEHKNLAVSGASDDRAARTTIEYLGKLKKLPNFDPSKIFVIVNWPGFYRTEIHQIKEHEAGCWDAGWMPVVAGNDETYKQQCSPSAYAYYRAWIMRNNHFQACIKFYSNVLLLQNILISNKIKYLFWNSCGTVSIHKNEHYHDELYHKRFPFILDKEKSYTDLLELNGYRHSPKAVWGHYGEDGQEWFADFLHGYITKEKLL